MLRRNCRRSSRGGACEASTIKADLTCIGIEVNPRGEQFLGAEANACSTSLSRAQVANYTKVTENMDSFDVVDRPLDFLTAKSANVTCIQKQVVNIDPQSRVLTFGGETGTRPLHNR